MIKVFASFLLLSGIASLTYQVVWVRLLGISMGSTSASISTVLAAFFFGLAIGSYFAERLTKNIISDLRPYLILEAIIAISGLLLLPVLVNLDSVIAGTPGLAATVPMKFIVTMILLSIPTICMGATFPVMATLLIRRQNDCGMRMSQLYSLNTAGAVLGAILSGFVFIPAWGLDGAVYLAVSINLSIVAAGYYFNKRIRLEPLEETKQVDINTNQTLNVLSETPLFQKRALSILFITGFVSIACEVAWTKYLSIFTGSTIYGFSAILAIFLVGISLGSWAIRNYISRIKNPDFWVSILVIALGLSLIGTRVALTWVPDFYEFIGQLHVDDWLIRALKYGLVFIILIIPTFILGALFPINLKLYCGDVNGIRSRIGKAYAVNTVASIFGAVLAGFVIIPMFGTDQLLTAMAFLLLVSSIMFLPSIKSVARKISLSLSIIIIMLGNIGLPHLDYRDLITSIDYNAKYANSSAAYINPTYLFLKEGKTGVVSMVTYDGVTVYLANNGLKESIFDLKNPYRAPVVESLLGLIPYFLHPKPKKAFVVGFGGGVTTRALSFTKLESIKVVELEPAVVDAGRAVYGGKIPVLQDPRVSVEFNDARNTLLRSKQKYDIISSQPSHPWLAYAATVFTQEFFSLVRSRLTEKGIYGQWVNLFRMDATTLKSLFKSFYSVFPEGMVFANTSTGDLIMFGSKQKIVFDFQQIAKRMKEKRIKLAMSFQGIKDPKDILNYFALSREQALAVSRHVRINTDLNILSEVRLSGLAKILPYGENPYHFLRKHYRLEIKSYFTSDVPENLYKVGRHLLAQNRLSMATFIMKQLKNMDLTRSRNIEYEILWRRFYYRQAMVLYKSHKNWPDRIHMQQALLLSKENKVREARLVFNKIVSRDIGLKHAARMLFSENKYNKNSSTRFSGEIVKNLLGWNKKTLIEQGRKLASRENSIH